MVISTVALGQWQDIMLRMQEGWILCTLWPGNKKKGRRRGQGLIIPFKTTSCSVQPHLMKVLHSPPNNVTLRSKPFSHGLWGDTVDLLELQQEDTNTCCLLMQKTSPRLFVETVSCSLEGTKLHFGEVYFKHVLVYKEKNTHRIIRDPWSKGDPWPQTLTLLPWPRSHFSGQPKETRLSSCICGLVKCCQRHCWPCRLAFPLLYLCLQYLYSWLC